MIQSAISITITVYFDDPFWVGVLELNSEGKLRTSRTVFGAEPKDYEVYEYILNHYYSLKFSRPNNSENKPEKRISPKRMKREINRQLKQKSVSTKAQQAIQMEMEQNKQERKVLSRKMKQQYKQEQYELKQIKKKKKKKGH